MASSSASFVISQEDVNLFHLIDRKLYALLVNELLRDPLESMHVMSLWLWLERVGFRHIVKQMLCLPHTIINDVANEALVCLHIISSPTTSSLLKGFEIPFTQNLIKNDISIQFFHENRAAAIVGMDKVRKEVCDRILIDIMGEVIEKKRNTYKGDCPLQRRFGVGGEGGGGGVGVDPYFNEFYKTRCFTVDKGFSTGGGGSSGGGEIVDVKDRSLFLTFSNGFPVAESEVRGFFTRSFGDCIEYFYMQKVSSPEEQALYAKVVFHSRNIVDIILKGASIAKFNIKGKPVWMRKFEVKPLEKEGNQSGES